MRNLKKVLSLTLALVMMLGMMTFAGAAETTKITSKDLTDMDKVVNKEAVTLLVDLGIINGIKAADGTYTFNPAGNIERGAYAKMVYAVKLATDKADVYKGANTGLTDVKGHWAEGYIAYCVSTKIAAGNPNKTFTPNANITVVAASKMLLTALGYDAKLSKYENDALWAINIMADAQSAGLMNGVELGADAVLTRDAAAQMIFNALFSTTVTPVIDRDQGVAYLTDYKHAYTTLGQNVFGLAKVTATVNAISPALDLTVVDPADGNLTAHTNAVTAAENPDSGLKITADMVGCNVTFYSKNTVSVNPATHAVTLGYKSLYSSTANGTASTVLATVTGGIDNFDNAVKSGHDDFVAKVETGTSASDSNYAISTYLNGTKKDDMATEDALEDTFLAAIAKAGVITEFIDTDADGIAEIVKATEKTVYVVGASGATTKTVNGKVQVKVEGVTDLASYNSANTTANVFGYEGLKEDDVVLSYKSNGNYYLEKAAMVAGQLTATKGSKLIISGTNYTVSGLTGAVDFAGVKAQGFNADVNYYLDNGGHIVKAVAVKEAAKAQFAIVIGWTNRDSFGGTNVEAKLLFADGTTKTGKVTQFANTETGALDDVVLDGAGAHDLATAFGAKDTACAHPVAYTIDKDGNYNLSLLTAGGTNKLKVLLNATITNNKATFCANITSNSTGGPLVGNDKTVFLVKTPSGVDVYNGIAKAPAYTTSSTSDPTTETGAHGVAIVDKNGLTVMVYLTQGTNNGYASTIDRAYIIDNTTNTYYPAISGKTNAYYEYDAIINGEVTTIKATLAATKKITANTVYELTLNKDGLVTDVTAVVTTGANTWATGVKHVDGVVKVGSVFYALDADSLIYVIDGNTASVVKPADLAEDLIATALVVAKNATTDATLIKELYVIKNSVKLPAHIAVTGTATLTTNTDLLAGPVKVTGGDNTKTVIITPTVTDGFTFSVTIDGAGIDKTTDAAATYALVDGDNGSVLNVAIKITVDSTGATQTLKYQIPVAITVSP